MKQALRFAPALFALASCTGAQVPQADLTNSAWAFETIDGKAPISNKAALTFRAGQLGATVGCNAMGGAWNRDGSRLIIAGLLSTKMFCANLAQQEIAVSALLGASPQYRIDGARLTLDSGTHQAILRRITLP